MWKINTLTITNQVVVAPMAGVTDLAYRQILKSFGAGLIFTEMVSDKGLFFHNDKTIEMLETTPYERPVGLQLFGSDVESMVHAAQWIDEKTSADIIDINMGCPVQKVVKSGAGSKLMTTPELAIEIVQAIVQSVKKPVTVKIRSGWDADHINALDIAIKLEKAGIRAISVHPRTRSQLYSGRSDWSIIEKVKTAVQIPVIGNGDILFPEDAKKMILQTGCDAVMIGRGLLGNPWLIEQTISYLETGDYRKEIPYSEKHQVMMDHFERLLVSKGEKIAVLEMRSHGPWYLKGLPNSTHPKTLLAKASKAEEVRQIIDRYFADIV